jgi:glycosyltransferase involved in cell wall biosynthesis
MKKINQIIVAATGYPTPTDPAAPFVEQLVHAISLKAIEVIVIAPQSIVKHWLRHTELHPRHRSYSIEGGAKIEVYQPTVLSFGGRFTRLNDYFLKRAIDKTARKLKCKPDLCYGHFWHFAYFLYPYAKNTNLPLFVATGEARITLHQRQPVKKLTAFVDYIKGVICVSTKNRDESITDGLLADASKSVVIPNAIDNGLFKLMDRQALRQARGLKESDFVVAFTGWYDHNKGVRRVSDAINMLNDSDIKSFFIGGIREGDGEMPDCDGILHKGRMPHDQIPEYLNMADVFVLPSLMEGCNNSIIEAMACGLPIIASDRPFNKDVLTKNNSILVDPLNVTEISNAIKKIKDDKELKQRLSKGALETAKTLTINRRAERILNFIESKMPSD